jgi:predicted hotdog family 3-hydroxylacyl-ACP dehydratase
MCLLEHVVAYDDTSICCETRSHLDAGNPLRYKGRLSSLCGIEYAAQAMALHGALKTGAFGTSALKSGAATAASDGRAQLSDPAGARHGFLASVRDTRISRRYMDDLNCPLSVNAVLEFDDASRVIYAFSVKAGDAPLVSGRAAVVLG